MSRLGTGSVSVPRVTASWERGRPVRTAGEGRSFFPCFFSNIAFALRAQCGRDVRAPGEIDILAQLHLHPRLRRPSKTLELMNVNSFEVRGSQTREEMVYTLQQRLGVSFHAIDAVSLVRG
jgi:hypothetical protein